MVAPLLKAYQEEIDRLAGRAKSGEGAFLDVYQKLYEAPDPAPALAAGLVRKLTCDENTLSLVRVSGRVHGYSVQKAVRGTDLAPALAPRLVGLCPDAPWLSALSHRLRGCRQRLCEDPDPVSPLAAGLMNCAGPVEATDVLSTAVTSITICYRLPNNRSHHARPSSATLAGGHRARGTGVKRGRQDSAGAYALRRDLNLLTCEKSCVPSAAA